MITTLQSHTAQATSTFGQGNPSFGMRGTGRTTFNNNGGRGGPGGKGLPLQSTWKGQPQPQRPHSQPSTIHLQQEQGNAKTYTDNQCWQC